MKTILLDKWQEHGIWKFQIRNHSIWKFSNFWVVITWWASAQWTRHLAEQRGGPYLLLSMMWRNLHRDTAPPHWKTIVQKSLILANSRVWGIFRAGLGSDSNIKLYYNEIHECSQKDAFQLHIHLKVLL